MYARIRTYTYVRTYVRTYIHIYSWIYENMIDENYSSFTKTGPNKGNYKPDEPENHRKERKEGKRARAREKKTSNSLVFIVWTSAEGHPQTLTQSDLVFIYIYI